MFTARCKFLFLTFSLPVIILAAHFNFALDANRLGGGAGALRIADFFKGSGKNLSGGYSELRQVAGWNHHEFESIAQPETEANLDSEAGGAA